MSRALHGPTWRPIPGYEGFYEVSDNGQVRSVKRTITATRVGKTLEWNLQSRVIKQREHNGYRMVTLSRNADHRHVFVHVLVLEAFDKPRPPGMECLHANGNRADNSLDNLRWGTRSENRHDSVRHGTHPAARRTHCSEGHPLQQISPRKRGCKECRRRYQREWARKRLAR